TPPRTTSTTRRGWRSGRGCRSFCWSWLSTCWATGCAMRSTRANADGDATMTPQALLVHSDEGRLWPADAPAPIDLPMGYKIGFTNRTIWQRYGVYAPIWGTVWDTTLTHCDGRGGIDLTATCQPR